MSGTHVRVSERLVVSVVAFAFPLAVTWSTPRASADILVFEHAGRGGGTLGGSFFRETDFMIRATADTADRVQIFSLYSIEHQSVEIELVGIGVFQVLSPATRTFASGSMVGFGREGGGDFYNGPSNPALSGWDMLTPIGPVSGTGTLLQWAGLPQVVTNAGVLEFANGTCDATFTAIGSPPCIGDVDGSGAVDLADLSALLANFGTPGGATLAMGDVDGDGDVDLNDLSTLLANFGVVCP